MAAESLCSIPDCGKPAIKRGWCNAHYKRWLRHGDPKAGAASPDGTQGCAVEGCHNKHAVRGYCAVHHMRIVRYGDPSINLLPKRKKGEAAAYYRDVVLAYHGEECLQWPFNRTGKGYGALWRDGENRLVSRLVCEDVYGPPPTPEHEAAHSCGKGHEGCCAQNHLRWATREENYADKVLHGTDSRGERNGVSKLTEKSVRQIRELSETTNYSRLAKKFGVGRSTIKRIVKREAWAWLR